MFYYFQIMKEMGRFKKGTNGQSPVLLKNTEDTDSIICIEPIEDIPIITPHSEETDKSTTAEVTTDTKEEVEEEEEKQTKKKETEQEVQPAIIDISITENKPETEVKTEE